MTNTLSDKKCLPCEAGSGHLMKGEIEEYLKETPDWSWQDFHHIERSFKFPDFKTALEFVNKVGALAESEGHHPDIELSWGKVKIKLFTHSVDGLTENDFILAVKIDTLH